MSSYNLTYRATDKAASNALQTRQQGRRVIEEIAEGECDQVGRTVIMPTF